MEGVRIFCKDPEINLTVPMGDGPAVLTGGFGGYEIVDRQDDVGMTDWSGQQPITQDVPLLLNGFESDTPVQRSWDLIKRLGRDADGDERRPPVFQVSGPVEYPRKWWVLPAGGIDTNAGSVIRSPGSGELLRIEFTLHLLEFVKPAGVKVRRAMNQGNGPIGGARALTHTVSKGETLQTIAASVFGNWKRWKEIGQKNGIADPNRVLPAGRVLKL